MSEEKIRSYCQFCGKITEKEKVGTEGVWIVYRCNVCKNLVLLPP